MKFTNQQLYSWMVSKLSSVYFQAYQMALPAGEAGGADVRARTGAGRGEPQRFIQPTYWDSLKKGLLAGEQLHTTSRRMEAAYLDANRRELEITKHVSLLPARPGGVAATAPDRLLRHPHPGGAVHTRLRRPLLPPDQGVSPHDPVRRWTSCRRQLHADAAKDRAPQQCLARRRGRDGQRVRTRPLGPMIPGSRRSLLPLQSIVTSPAGRTTLGCSRPICATNATCRSKGRA